MVTGKKSGVEFLRERNSVFQTKESEAKGRNFAPRADDIFITTYPKCGTTWVTQIVHGLRSNGDMNFNEITERCPWDCLALDCKQDVDADQDFSPRVFKSHEPWELIAKPRNGVKGTRYIHVARDPLDAFYSFYQFLPPYVGVPLDDISVEEFCNSIFAGVSNSGQIWDFYLSWYKLLLKPPDDVKVLWIFFEDLKTDLESQVRKIANFLDLPSATGEEKEALIQKVLKQSTYAFMKEHEGKFDDHFVFNNVKTRMGLGQVDKPAVGKVREGKTGSKKDIPKEVIQRLEEKWQKTIASATSILNYSQLMEKVKAHQEKFS